MRHLGVKCEGSSSVPGCLTTGSSLESLGTRLDGKWGKMSVFLTPGLSIPLNGHQFNNLRLDFGPGSKV